MANNVDFSQPELFSQAFKYAPIGMALVSTEGNWLHVNSSLCQIIGYSESEFLGMTFQDITHPDDLHSALDVRNQFLEGKLECYQMEKRFIHKNGFNVWALLVVSIMRDERRQPLFFITQIKDITESKLAEQDLKAKTEQLESFIEHNADAILIFNNESVVQRVNETFSKIFGWSKEDIVGIDLHSLPFIPAEYLDEITQNRNQLKKGQSIVGAEVIRKRKEGEILNVLLTASPVIDVTGNKNGWSTTIRDITEWKIAQEHLQNSEKLSVAGQLAAGIAHEIRNPITSIKGFIQLMKSGFGEKQKYFDIMTSEIERIELILSELLILAKPQSIKYERKVYGCY